MESSPDSLLTRLDLSSVVDPIDKIEEAEFFLGLASSETARKRFRWLITAFLNAIYSYFETTACSASIVLTHPETGEICEDTESLGKLRPYVDVDAKQNKRRPSFVKTTGRHAVIRRLYEIRRAATHHFPLSIMAAGSNLPEDFHLGSLKGQGQPLLPLCREALAVVKQVQAGLDT